MKRRNARALFIALAISVGVMAAGGREALAQDQPEQTTPASATAQVFGAENEATPCPYLVQRQLEELTRENERAAGAGGEKKNKWVDIAALVQTVVLWKNDADFDPTKPAYNEEGQTVGLAATIFQPKVTFNIYDALKLYYEAEVGLNVWSKNNPDQYDPTNGDIFFLKHRELWSSGSFYDDHLGFKVGYQRYRDATGLFLNHWMGAGTIYTRIAETRIYLTAGQAPDTTYEGLVLTENNFVHDSFTFNLNADTILGGGFSLNGGVYSLLDNRVIDRQIVLVNPALALKMDLGQERAALSGMLQLGSSEFGIPGVDVSHTAWAAQAHGDLDYRPVSFHLNALLLGPDDQYHGNNFDGAFFYSGKNSSATVLLTEDELRDHYDNFDERLGVKDGGFYLLRPGLAVADAKVQGHIADIFEPALIAGVGFALEPENALGESYVGTELALDLGLKWRDALTFHVLAGVFLPGGAAAALINRIQRDRREAVFEMESSLAVNF